jgi:hypothetical protein
MPGHSRSKNGVASLAYVPGIHVLLLFCCVKDVDGRDEPAMTMRGTDGRIAVPTKFTLAERGSAGYSRNRA